MAQKGPVYLMWRTPMWPNMDFNFVKSPGSGWGKRGLPDSVKYSAAAIKAGENPIVRTHRCVCGSEFYSQLTTQMKSSLRINDIGCECGGTMYGSLVISGDRYKEWRPSFERNGDGDLNDEMIRIVRKILGEDAIVGRYALRTALEEALGNFENKNDLYVFCHHIIGRPGLTSSNYFRKDQGNSGRRVEPRIRTYSRSDRRTIEGKVLEKIVLQAGCESGVLIEGGQTTADADCLEGVVHTEVDAICADTLGPVEIATRDRLHLDELQEHALATFNRVVKKKLYQLGAQVLALGSEVAHLVFLESSINKFPIALAVTIDADSLIKFARSSPGVSSRKMGVTIADNDGPDEPGSETGRSEGPGEEGGVIEDELVALKQPQIESATASQTDGPYSPKKDSEIGSEGRTWDVERKIIRALGEIGDDEWVNLAKLGFILRRLFPGFSHQSYGYDKLSSLIRDLPMLEYRSEEKMAFVRVNDDWEHSSWGAANV